MHILYNYLIFNRKKTKASMTIFVSMILLLVVSLLLTFLESSRVYGLKAFANNINTMSIESTFAEYQKQLFEMYDVLFLDGSYGKESFDLECLNGTLFENADDNLNNSKKNQLYYTMNIFQLHVADVSLDSYELATDQNGIVFYQQAVEAMKARAGFDLVSSLKSDINSIQDATGNQTSVEEKLQQAQQSIENAKAKRQKQAEENNRPVIISKEEQNAQNPIDFVMKLKKEGILGLVVDHPENISKEYLNERDSLQKRSYDLGTLKYVYSDDPTNKLWFQYYINQHFGNYTKTLEHTKLKYEQEYLICEKDSDIDNLKGVVDRLLLVREALNFAYLMTDTLKVEQAQGIASALVGFSLSPPIVMAVQMGILAAWAFIESILDVRQLLSGNKIMPIKTQETWNTDILHISESFEGAKNKKCEKGLSYQQYLHVMLFLKSKEQLSLGTMNLIEKNIQLQTKNTSFQMNKMIQSMKVTYEYDANPLFSEILEMTRDKLSAYHFSYVKQFSYRKEMYLK